MIKYIFTAVSFFLLNVMIVQAQPENILITNTSNPEEPSIFINPTNPAMVMAGVNIHYIYLSLDSGKTWAGTNMTSTSGVWGDPCIVADTNGDFLFFHLANPAVGNWIDRIVCQKYEINNSSWTIDSYMGLNGTKAQDKQWCAVDPRTNILYVSWTEFDDYGSTNPTDSSRILFSRSFDAGVTWSPAKRINKLSGDCIDSDNTVEGAVPAVGPNGEVYVCWAGPAGLVFDKSLDSGNTWLENDIVIGPIPDGWDYEIDGISRANGLPITLCDLSGGPYHGTIYVSWSDQRNGTGNTDVFITKSSDGGLTWSAPLRINDDTTQTQQFFTWMTIDQTTGWLYAVFYDRRNYTDTRTDVYMAVSKDGGQSFENHLISKSPFIPNSNIFFGDYTNISAYNGMVRPIWTRLNNDSLSVWTAIIHMDSVNSFIGYTPKSGTPIAIEAYPNPAKDRIAFSFKLKTTETIHIDVTDIQGKTVAVLINQERRDAGMYIEHFDINSFQLKPGTYFFNLQAEGKNIRTKKFIIN